MFDLTEVGTRVINDNGQLLLSCGIYLKNITDVKGYDLKIRIIHQNDQYNPDIPALDFSLQYIGGDYGLWQATINLSDLLSSHSFFGQTGQYVYRYQLWKNSELKVAWFSDPYATQCSVGTFSLFDTSNINFDWSDESFKVPRVDDMIVYELMVDEFNHDFDGIVSRLDYLGSIGVNVIELMPITNIKESFRWGYMPLNFYAPEQRYGGALALKRLINACHNKGIAVIVDAVYAHAHPDFPYSLVYDQTSESNPMMGQFAEDAFGLGTDFNQNFTREFFLNVNKYWIQTFHVDGFRYDYVPGFYDGATGSGYANLVFETYQFCATQQIARFDAGSYTNIIQCAEHLPDPQGILSNTYSNCCWQNELMDKSIDMAHFNYVDDSYVHKLCLIFKNYPNEYHNPSSNDRFPVNAFQYIESHDHSRLITAIGLTKNWDILGQAFGNRQRWFKLQAFIIGLYTCQGIPMLWNGQEFGENYSVPNSGNGRVFLARPLHWEYFYDNAGQGLISLYRKMALLRQQFDCLRSRNSYYYNTASSVTRGVVIYQRSSSDAVDAQKCIIFLNFNDNDQTVLFNFPNVGLWNELLHQQQTITSNSIEQAIEIRVPSNYGLIYSQSK